MFLINETLGTVNPGRDFDESDKWREQALLDQFKQRIVSQAGTPRPFADEKLPVLAFQALADWRQRNWSTPPPLDRVSQPRQLDENTQLEIDYLDDLAREYGSIRLAGFKKHLRVHLELEQL